MFAKSPRKFAAEPATDTARSSESRRNCALVQTEHARRCLVIIEARALAPWLDLDCRAYSGDAVRKIVELGLNLTFDCNRLPVALI